MESPGNDAGILCMLGESIETEQSRVQGYHKYDYARRVDRCIYRLLTGYILSMFLKMRTIYFQ